MFFTVSAFPKECYVELYASVTSPKQGFSGLLGLGTSTVEETA
jgi:hypothetical protein